MEVATTLFGYVEFDGHGASWRVVHPYFTFPTDG
jgi:hypothetical protein